jgi:hypothetical protein
MKLAGHAAHMGEMKNNYKILFEKLERKRQHGGSWRRSEGNIKWI